MSELNDLKKSERYWSKENLELLFWVGMVYFIIWFFNH